MLTLVATYSGGGRVTAHYPSTSGAAEVIVEGPVPEGFRVALLQAGSPMAGIAYSHWMAERTGQTVTITTTGEAALPLR